MLSILWNSPFYTLGTSQGSSKSLYKKTPGRLTPNRALRGEVRILLDIVKSILYGFEVQQAEFSLRILVAGEKGVTSQENIVRGAPCLNKKYS